MKENKIIEGKKNKTLMGLLIAPCVILSIIALVLIIPFGEIEWPYVWYTHPRFFVGLGFLVIAVIFYFIFFAHSKSHIVVTDKRVYGKAMCGKQVDIPIDSISSVGSSKMFNRISVRSSSGLLSFDLMQNYSEIHSAISALLINRQSSSESATSMHQDGTTIEQLQKYKELLDNGVISQEEFDAKKKQLLGL